MDKNTEVISSTCISVEDLSDNEIRLIYDNHPDWVKINFPEWVKENYPNASLEVKDHSDEPKVLCVEYFDINELVSEQIEEIYARNPDWVKQNVPNWSGLKKATRVH